MIKNKILKILPLGSMALEHDHFKVMGAVGFLVTEDRPQLSRFLPRGGGPAKTNTEYNVAWVKYYAAKVTDDD